MNCSSLVFLKNKNVCNFVFLIFSFFHFSFFHFFRFHFHFHFIFLSHHGNKEDDNANDL